MEFSNVVNARYSVRKYKDTPVEADKLERILKSASLAPTAKNTNCVRIYAVTDKQKIAALKEVTPCTFDAPLLLVVCSDENEAWVSSRTGKSHGMMDASIAADHMMLTAVNEGLGTCWVCLFDPALMKEALKMPENVCPHCIIVCGYAADDSVPNERHGIRIPMDKLVTYVK